MTKRREPNDWVYAEYTTTERWVPAGGAFVFRCHRCQSRVEVLLPIGMNDIGPLMTAYLQQHKLCSQSLSGARWDLLCAFHRRKWALMTPEERQAASGFTVTLGV